MLKLLLDQLQATAPESRIDALCAFVMLEETQILDLLAKLWSSEQHPEVRQAIGWAGKQISAAQQRGYSTAIAMAQTFRYDLALQNEQEQAEQKLMAQVQNNVAIEKMKQHGNSDEKQQLNSAVKRTATAGVIGAAFGLGAGSILGMASPMGPVMTTLSDGTTNKPRIGTERIIPPRPTDVDIKLWLKRLNDEDTRMRASAIIQLRDFNNPIALGPLGKRFVSDADPAVRQSAQQTGKMLYFNALYWQEEDKKNPPKPKAAEPSAGDILAKAQAAKLKRTTQTR